VKEKTPLRRGQKMETKASPILLAAKRRQRQHLGTLALAAILGLAQVQAAFPTNITDIVADATTFHAAVMTFSVLAVAAAVAFRVIKGALKTR